MRIFPMDTVILGIMLSLMCCGEVFANTNMVPSVLTLTDARAIALRNHPRVAAANYRALAAQEVLKETRAGYYPNAILYGDAVGASSEDARILAGGLNNPTVFSRLAGGIGASQLITDFGHTANLVASSKYQSLAEAQNVNATREQVLLAVDINYLGLLQAQAVLRVALQTMETRELLREQISTLASNQLKSVLDVSFANVAVQESKLLVEKAQNDADESMASLSTALGYDSPRLFKLSEPAPFSAPSPSETDDSQLVQTALVQRPELLSLRNESEGAIKFAKSQRDARLPTLSAFGTAGSSPVHDSHLPNDYAVGGLEVSFPLFAGGLYVARQHEAQLRAQADAELLRNLENEIVRDVHIAWLNVNNAREEIETTRELVQNAGQAYELAEARYKIGSSSIVELSQAQLSLTSAQISDTNARYNLLIQQANLNYQIGALR
jgi:outer membrane protein